MRTLGIDPGTAILGYGIVDHEGEELQLITYGVIITPANMPLAQRLQHIYGSLNELLETYQPKRSAIEELFFSKNVRTALAVGHARGVAMLAIANKGIPVEEYTPLQVKQAVAGHGRATKDQIQQMVRLALNLDFIPQPDDAADAIAIAITHIFSARYMTLLAGKLDQEEIY